MADRKTWRTITSKTTIPAGTAGTGVATANASDNSWLDVTGGVIAEWDKLRHNSYRNMWVYVATEHKVAKVINIMALSANSYRLYLDRTLPFVFNNAFTVIVGDLIEWTAANKGGGTGYIKDQPIVNGQIVNATYKNVNSGVSIEQDAVTIDGSGTSFTVVETK